MYNTIYKQKMQLLIQYFFLSLCILYSNAQVLRSSTNADKDVTTSDGLMDFNADNLRIDWFDINNNVGFTWTKDAFDIGVERIQIHLTCKDNIVSIKDLYSGGVPTLFQAGSGQCIQSGVDAYYKLVVYDELGNSFTANEGTISLNLDSATKTNSIAVVQGQPPANSELKILSASDMLKGISFQNCYQRRRRPFTSTNPLVLQAGMTKCLEVLMHMEDLDSKTGLDFLDQYDFAVSLTTKDCYVGNGDSWVLTEGAVADMNFNSRLFAMRHNFVFKVPNTFDATLHDNNCKLSAMVFARLSQTGTNLNWKNTNSPTAQPIIPPTAAPAPTTATPTTAAPTTAAPTT
jgi:hypothetical protein